MYVGIVTFDAEVTKALAPTTDRDAARAVIESLSLNRSTLLYDGVLSAVDLAGTDGQRSVLVLSDGADTSPTPTPRRSPPRSRTATPASTWSRSSSRPTRSGRSQRLADAGGGQVISADSEALATAFSAEAAILASQVLVTAQIPADVTASQATVEVTLPSSDGDITASAYSTIQAQGDGVAAPDDRRSPGRRTRAGPRRTGRCTPASACSPSAC